MILFVLMVLCILNIVYLLKKGHALTNIKSILVKLPDKHGNTIMLVFFFWFLYSCGIFLKAFDLAQKSLSAGWLALGLVIIGWVLYRWIFNRLVKMWVDEKVLSEHEKVLM